jgi:tRNA(Ile)-lysidine synthase TilS/MesJ
MDTISDPNITFDENGICNYYYEYLDIAKRGLFNLEEGKKKLEEMALLIKNRAKSNKYDCILGLSGGAGSTYLAFIAKEIGLNPLVVHFDYGWNLEAAVHNIEQTMKVLNFDLYTEFMDWPEFKDLLASYIKSSVLDLDVPADHLIFAALSKVARKHRIKSIISGFNIKSEAILPKTWNYDRKFDLTNMLNIHAKFGTLKLNKIPKLDIYKQLMNTYYYKLKGFAPLNYINYDKNEVKQFLTEKMKWSDYAGKHCENIFARFYQG